MKISSIVAMNAEGIIGFENQIPWYLPTDLSYFAPKNNQGDIVSLMGKSVLKVLENHCR